MHLVFHTAMIDPLFSSTPAPSNLLLAINLNMNFNPETTMHDDAHNVKKRQPDNLYESVLFEPLIQIRVGHVMFKVTSFSDFWLYLKSFAYLENMSKVRREANL